MTTEHVFPGVEVPAMAELLDVPPEQVEQVRLKPGRMFVDLRTDDGEVTVEIPTT